MKFARYIPVFAGAGAAFVFIVAIALAAALAGDAALPQLPQVASLGLANVAWAPLLPVLFVFSTTLLSMWGISVDYRCTSHVARRRLKALTGFLVVVTAASPIAGPGASLLAIAADLVIALAIELGIGFGIIPSAHEYRTLFRYLPLDLKVLNDGGRVFYATESSTPRDNATHWRIVSSIPKSARLGEVVHARSGEHTGHKAYRLNGGIGLLSEDVSEIEARQRTLEARQKMLEEQNALIVRNQARRADLFRLRRERELEQLVESDLSAAADEIRQLLDSVPSSSDETRRDERLRMLNRVKLLVAYSKRKGMLALAASTSKRLTRDELVVITTESSTDLRSIGIEAATFIAVENPLPIDVVNAFYDSFYDCILAVLPHAAPVVMASIANRSDGTAEMRVNIECAIGLGRDDAVERIPAIATSTEAWDAVQENIAHDLEARLALRPSTHTLSIEDGLVSVAVWKDAPASVESTCGADAPAWVPERRLVETQPDARTDGAPPHEFDWDAPLYDAVNDVVGGKSSQASFQRVTYLVGEMPDDSNDAPDAQSGVRP